METPSRARARQEKLARIQLVARVQLAYEQFRDLALRAGANDDAVQAARTHLDALNTLLALLTLEAG